MRQQRPLTIKVSDPPQPSRPSEQLSRRQFMQLASGLMISHMPLMTLSTLHPENVSLSYAQPTLPAGWNALPSNSTFGTRYGVWLGTMYALQRMIGAYMP